MKEVVPIELLRKSRPGNRGLIQHIENVQQQLSEHRQKLTEAQAQLRLSTSRYDELFDLAPVGFLTLSRSGRIIELNEKTGRLLGFPPAWLMGRPFVVFVATQDVQRFLKILTESIRRIVPENTTELTLDVAGRMVPVQVSLSTSLGRAGAACRMSLLDLTEVKKSESDLQRSLDNWHSLVHNAPETIMLVEQNGKIVFANQPIWGRSVRSLLGTSIFEHVPGEESVKLKRCIKEAFDKDTRSSCEIGALDGGGRKAWFSLSFGPVHADPGGKGRRRTTTLMIREISEQKRAEQTLRDSGEQLREFAARLEAVREEERTRVAREIHDELGQALTILKLDLAWLQKKTPRQQPETRTRVKAMMQQVDQTIDCVRRIASELRPAILDDLGLIAAIEWQLKEFQKRTGIKSTFRSNTDKMDSWNHHPAAAAAAAAAAVFRVIQEALTNIMRHAKASSVRVELDAGKHGLRISITDNGKGMSEDRLKNGQSLGIVGMKERIARIGGDFMIYSQPGKGTRIEMVVPVET